MPHLESVSYPSAPALDQAQARKMGFRPKSLALAPTLAASAPEKTAPSRDDEVQPDGAVKATGETPAPRGKHARGRNSQQPQAPSAQSRTPRSARRANDGKRSEAPPPTKDRAIAHRRAPPIPNPAQRAHARRQAIQVRPPVDPTAPLLAQQEEARPRVLAAATAQALKQPPKTPGTANPSAHANDSEASASTLRCESTTSERRRAVSTPTSHKIVFPTPGSPERMSIDGPSATPARNASTEPSSSSRPIGKAPIRLEPL